jgi:predicted transcriptional regulator
MKHLDYRIVSKLSKKLGRTENTIKKDIYLLQKKYPRSTKNAVAQIYATAHKNTIYRMLDKEDKVSLPSIEVEKEKIIVKTKQIKTKKKDTRTIFDYDTEDHFVKVHIEELNRAYYIGRCYTCVFILVRKIIENLIIDILHKKFPKDKELYFDISKGRFKDFNVIIDNLDKKSNDFDVKKKAVNSLCSKLKPFKKEANDRTHSLYYIVESQNEINEVGLKTIVALIIELEKFVGIRQ